jgi:predicted TIM-barrel fold metal-dependent hydrolase
MATHTQSAGDYVSSTRPASIIDVHTHVIAADQARYPLAPLSGKQSDWSRERPVSFEQMIAAMDEAGVAKVSLVQASTCYGSDNSYVAAAVAARPDRFSGVFSTDLTQPDAIDAVKNWVGQGLRSLRVFIAGHTASAHDAKLDDPRAYPAWAYAEANRIPINVQLRADGLPQLVALLERFPKAVAVLDHFARPVLEDGPPYAQAASLFALARFPNLFFKFTTHNVRESKQGRATQESFAKKVVAEFGAKRIAWGSNFPASAGTLSSLLNDALEATGALSSEDRDWIFGRTAEVIYPELKASPR